MSLIVKGQRLSSATEFKKGQKPRHRSDYNEKTSQRMMGHFVSDITREKLRQANLGKRGAFKHTDEFKKKQSERMKGNQVWRKARGIKKENTKCEKMLGWALEKIGFCIQRQVHLCGVTFADFYLPEYRIVVYADGDYWHNRPEIKARDARINEVLRANGFMVYRFLASDIEQSAIGCAKRIMIPHVE